MPIEQSNTVSGSNAFRNTRLLVVDDDSEFTRSVSDYLGGMGFSIETAHNGREGLALFRSGDFPVVLADLQMPGMSGADLLQNIKQIDKRAAVVILTGFGTDNALSAVKNDAYDIVPKPVTPQRVGVIVQRAVEQQTLLKRIKVLRRLTLGLIVSIPFWVITGVLLAQQYLAR